jgi:hypothetical protein
MHAEIHCLKYENGISTIDQSGTIDEVYFFSVYVSSDFRLSSPTLVLTDIPLRLILLGIKNDKYIYLLDEVSVRDYFKTQDFYDVFDIYKQSFPVSEIVSTIPFYKLFVNYPIGECTVRLFNHDGDIMLFQKKINITSLKIEADEFTSLISYIEKRGSFIWAKYSLIKNEAHGINVPDHLDWLLVFIEDLLEVFTEKYLFRFAYDKISILVPKGNVESFEADTSISEDSILWLFENLDVLHPTVSYDLNKVIINRRPFAPNEIFALNLFDSTDCIENQVVHGFFNELNNYLLGLLHEVKIHVDKGNNATFEDFIEIYALKMKVGRLNQLIVKLGRVLVFLEEHIPVTRNSVDILHLNKVEVKEHYDFVHRQFLRWLNNKGAGFLIHNKHFQGITRLDQLFEKACFFNLIETLIAIGYEIRPEELSGKKISLVKGTATHFLYCQSIPDGLTTVKRGSGNLKPDFVLDLGDNGYVIMDAKYKKSNNISKYDYPDLVLKYLHGIGPDSGGVFNVKSLLIFYPDKINRASFYQENEYIYGGRHLIFPVIGSIGFNFGNDNIQLIEILSNILESL